MPSTNLSAKNLHEAMDYIHLCDIVLNCLLAIVQVYRCSHKCLHIAMAAVQLIYSVFLDVSSFMKSPEDVLRYSISVGVNVCYT